jgi:hypothetical protein
MTAALKELVEAARKAKMSPKDREEQRRSFAYGNANIENERVTREKIDEEAEALARDVNG